MIYVEWNVN